MFHRSNVKLSNLCFCSLVITTKLERKHLKLFIELAGILRPYRWSCNAATANNSRKHLCVGGSCSWSRDENVKVGLQFIEAYQTVLWFQSSLPISRRGVAVGVGRADLRCASRGLNRHLSGFDANPSREKLLSSGFMVRILEFFNFDIQILDSNSSKLWKRSSCLGTGILMIDAS